MELDKPYSEAEKAQLEKQFKAINNQIKRRNPLLVEREVQTDKQYSQESPFKDLADIQEDHKKRLKNLLIENLVEFNKTNSPNDLVNAIFDCRALYNPPSSLYGNPYDMVNILKRDICEWVVKLQQI